MYWSYDALPYGPSCGQWATLCLAGSALLAVSAAAQTSSVPAGPPLSVQEAVQIALKNNPRLVAMQRDIHATAEITHSAGSLTNPQVFFAPSLTGGVGGGSDTEFLASQPLELNGARSARKGSAQARQHLAEATAAREGQSIAFAVRTAYYELVRARSQATLAHDLLNTSEELDRLARRQVELGSRPAVEQVQTGIEVTRARQQVTLNGSEVAAREAALNALLNRSQGTPLGTVSLPDLKTTTLPSATEAVHLALANRADVQASTALVETARQEVRLTRAEGVPDLAPQFRAGSITRGIQQSGFGIAMTLPFLDYGSRRGRIRAAEETVQAEELRVASTRLQVEQEAAQSVAMAQGAQTVLLSFAPTEQGGQNLLADAERLLRANRVGYEEGKTTVISLIEAQRTYRQIQAEYINAQVTFALALAELSRATGGAQ